eukprot:jgi/Chlat1/9213/Chrsp98S08481
MALLFTKLDDTPMLRQQLANVEDNVDALKDRCNKLLRGCKKYRDAVSFTADSHAAFGKVVEAFCGTMDDPLSVAVGGPVMHKFTAAMKDTSLYLDVLKTQMDHFLVDRIAAFTANEIQQVKEMRKKFDKASSDYDAKAARLAPPDRLSKAREKFLHLKKDTKPEVFAEYEEDLKLSRTVYEQARFNLIAAMARLESHRKFEFLEAVSASMDAHLRFFKQGHELFMSLEPYIHQVLKFSQQSREQANQEEVVLADRMAQYRKEMDNRPFLPLTNRKEPSVTAMNGANGYAPGMGIGVGTSGMLKSGAESQVHITGIGERTVILRQGYLFKRSSSILGDWKRRFFVLDSRGILYYYRTKWALKESKQTSTPTHTVNLLTSTLKKDAEQGELRFCFRIISPVKTYTLQAENETDRSEWMDAITSVIASLIHSQSGSPTTTAWNERSMQGAPSLPGVDGRELAGRLSKEKKVAGHVQSVFNLLRQSIASSFNHNNPGGHNSGSDRPKLASESSDYSGTSTPYEPETPYSEDSTPVHAASSSSRQSFRDDRQDSARSAAGTDLQPLKPLDILRRIPGNDVCADCGASNPDWASLNLGVLLCIECSGIHRRLGVHISKVRSTTLDVKVWEPAVLEMFEATGNLVANAIWEEGFSQQKQVEDSWLWSIDDEGESPAGSPANARRRKAAAQLAAAAALQSHMQNSLQPHDHPHIHSDDDDNHNEAHAVAASHGIDPESLPFSVSKSQCRMHKTCQRCSDQWLVINAPAKPAPGDPIQGKNDFIISKYIDRKWVMRAHGSDDPAARCAALVQAIEDEDLPAAMRLLVNGVAVNKRLDLLKSPRPEDEPLSPGPSSEAASPAGQLSPSSTQAESFLHLACRTRNAAMVELLLQWGASIDAVDEMGRTPLHACILSHSAACARPLLMRGADANSQDRDGKTPMQMAMEHGRIADPELLVMLDEAAHKQIGRGNQH